MVDCFFPCQLDSLLNHTEKDGEKQDTPDVHERKHVGNKFDQNSVHLQYMRATEVIRTYGNSSVRKSRVIIPTDICDIVVPQGAS